MTPKQREQEAYFVESFDDGCSYSIMLDISENPKVSRWGYALFLVIIGI